MEGDEGLGMLLYISCLKQGMLLSFLGVDDSAYLHGNRVIVIVNSQLMD